MPKDGNTHYDEVEHAKKQDIFLQCRREASPDGNTVAVFGNTLIGEPTTQNMNREVLIQPLCNSS
jgi:hypothetical protein